MSTGKKLVILFLVGTVSIIIGMSIGYQTNHAVGIAVTGVMTYVVFNYLSE